MRSCLAWFLCLALPFAALAAEPTFEDHPEWSKEFADRDVAGTAVLFDESANCYLVFDRKRAETPFIPASTFKVFNTRPALVLRAEHGSPAWHR
jgi:beta-lactamase class D